MTLSEVNYLYRVRIEAALASLANIRVESDVFKWFTLVELVDAGPTAIPVVVSYSANVLSNSSIKYLKIIIIFLLFYFAQNNLHKN